MGVTRQITLEARTHGDYIRQERQFRGLSRRQMAESIGRTESWLRHVEEGRTRTIKAPDWAALCRAYGLEHAIIEQLRGKPNIEEG